MAAALSDGTVHLFSAGGDGKTLTANGTLRGHGGPVTAVAFATPALLLSIAADGVQELELPAGGGQVTQPTAKCAAFQRALQRCAVSLNSASRRGYKEYLGSWSCCRAATTSPSSPREHHTIPSCQGLA